MEQRYTSSFSWSNTEALSAVHEQKSRRENVHGHAHAHDYEDEDEDVSRVRERVRRSEPLTVASRGSTRRDECTGEMNEGEVVVGPAFPANA